MPAPARRHAHSRTTVGVTATRSLLTRSNAPSKGFHPVRTRQRPPSRTWAVSGESLAIRRQWRSWKIFFNPLAESGVLSPSHTHRLSFCTYASPWTHFWTMRSNKRCHHTDVQENVCVCGERERERERERLLVREKRYI